MAQVGTKRQNVAPGWFKLLEVVTLINIRLFAQHHEGLKKDSCLPDNIAATSAEDNK